MTSNLLIKSFLSEKYNKYLFFLFFFTFLFGNTYLYLNKNMHNYMNTYKVVIPYSKKIDDVNLVGSKDIPFLSFYEFSAFIRNNDEIKKNCPSFSKNVRFTQWEARNSTDYRFQIKSVFQEKITNCINIVFEEIEKKRKQQILIVQNLSDVEVQIFQEGVEKVMNDIKLREFLKQLADATESLQSSENTKILEKSDSEDITKNKRNDLSEFEIINLIKDINLFEDYSSTIKLRQNFLTGYIFNFLGSYRALKYTNNLSTTEVIKVNNEYFLKKNIIKFNIAIVTLILVILIIINYRKFTSKS